MEALHIQRGLVCTYTHFSLLSFRYSGSFTTPYMKGASQSPYIEGDSQRPCPGFMKSLGVSQCFMKSLDTLIGPHEALRIFVGTLQSSYMKGAS